VRLIESGRPSEVYKPDFTALRQPVFLCFGSVPNELFFLKEDVFWLEISVGVTDFVNKGKRSEELL